MGAKRKSKKGFTRNQLLILFIVGCFDCLVAGCIIWVAFSASGMLMEPPVTLIAPGAGIALGAPEPGMGPGPTPTPAIALPPTWTPMASPTPEGLDLVGTFVPGTCSFEVPARAKVDCGHVLVPEFHNGAPGGVIRLATAIYRSKSTTPAPDPVVFLNGGPGGGSLDTLATGYKEFIEPLLAERDLVVFDQRGTGYSLPSLACPEYDAVSEDDMKRTYSSEKQSVEYPHAMRRCRDRLTSRGVHLDAYTSVENASDVRDVILALGYGQANLYGASYGTRLALTVMRDHPEVVRSAVLDAVEPIEEPMYNRHPASVDRLLHKLFDGCQADRGCRSTYPDLEKRYYSLVSRMDADPVELWVRTPENRLYRVRVTGTWITAAIFLGSYVTEVIPYLPRMIYEASEGDYDLVAQIVGFGLDTESDISVGMMLSVNCHEEMFATTPEQIAWDYDAYPDNVRLFSLEGLFGSPETLQTICQEWGAAPFDPREGEPVLSDLPALVLVGEYDPITPPDYARQVAQNLSASYFYEFPGQGHVVGVWQSECAAGMVRDFIRNPYGAPDSSCISQMSGPDFFR